VTSALIDGPTGLPVGFDHLHAFGAAGAHTNRPGLVAIHGYDTKYAMHALRLGLQGIELRTTCRITLPTPEPDR